MELVRQKLKKQREIDNSIKFQRKMLMACVTGIEFLIADKISGLFNDTVVGLPLGISSLSYVLICIATAYFRNITIRPNPIKDWFYFLFIISLINSINYSILTLFFSFNLILMNYLVNTFFTFLFYIIFVTIFKYYLKGLND